MTNQQPLKKRLVRLISSKEAHVPFIDAIHGLSFDDCILKPQGVPYSIYDLVFHCKVTQWDILQYVKNPHHISPEWPLGYWPEKNHHPSRKIWQDNIDNFLSDQKDMINIIENPNTDLFEIFPNGSGHDLFREIMVLCDHNAYHLGQIVLIRKMQNLWGN